MSRSKYAHGCTHYTFEHYGYKGDIFVAEQLESPEIARKLYARLLCKAITGQIVSEKSNVCGVMTVKIKGELELFALVVEENHFVAVCVDDECDGEEVVRAIIDGSTGTDDDGESDGIDWNAECN